MGKIVFSTSGVEHNWMPTRKNVKLDTLFNKNFTKFTFTKMYNRVKYEMQNYITSRR